MELFEQLRREYEFGTGTVKGVARKFGVHRRMVRQAVESAMPPLRGYKVRAKPALGPVEAFIDAILAADATAPRKQRHTARRIHQRILAELPGCAIAESTVRNHVRTRRRTGEARPTFVPQLWLAGGSGRLVRGGGRPRRRQVKLQVRMRSMASGAFPRLSCRGKAFPEAHEHAFAWFGGVFRILRCDNLTSARVLRGQRRDETVRFAFRSHWRGSGSVLYAGGGGA